MSKADRIYKGIRRSVREALGYDQAHWSRVVMDRTCAAFLESLAPSSLDALEISSDRWGSLGFKSRRTTRYPDFDICADVLNERFDLIVADQIFEHVADPAAAGRNVLTMLRPSGHFVVTTPFLIRLHEMPLDCWRWSEEGMRRHLEGCGFPSAAIQTGSWGNRACIRAMLRRPTKWPRRGWGSLENEADFPVVVWAFARKAPLPPPADLG